MPTLFIFFFRYVWFFLFSKNGEIYVPLWMVLLSNVEGKIESIDVARTKFIMHWERGVEMITKEDEGEDWIFLIHKLMSPTLTPNG